MTRIVPLDGYVVKANIARAAHSKFSKFGISFARDRGEVVGGKEGPISHGLFRLFAVCVFSVQLLEENYEREVNGTVLNTYAYTTEGIFRHEPPDTSIRSVISDS